VRDAEDTSVKRAVDEATGRFTVAGKAPNEQAQPVSIGPVGCGTPRGAGRTASRAPSPSLDVVPEVVDGEADAAAWLMLVTFGTSPV